MSQAPFANPAVTIARALTDTFTGIAPSDAPASILAQLIGAAMAALAAAHLFGWTPRPPEEPSLSGDLER